MDASPGDDGARQFLEFLACEPITETERWRQKRQCHFDLRFRGQVDFGLFGGCADAREHRQDFGFRISGFGFRVQVRPARRLDFFDQKIDHAFVQVVAAQARVSVRGEHLKHAVVQLEDRKVERAAAQIVNRDLRALLQFVQTVGQGRRR